jgi:uncharacterized SAM-binding protein YcdF (DUF218 family)
MTDLLNSERHMKQKTKNSFRKPRASFMRQFFVTMITAGLVLSLLILGSFVDFASRVTRLAVPAEPKADAIVVLTGGAERISAALSLLLQGRAKRLLITGVNPSTSQETLSKLTGYRKVLFDCCVDIDYKAMNTIGNATETKRWSKTHGFSSLIVVTSAYHLPRSLSELNHRLPNTELIGYPVTVEETAAENWWQKTTTRRLLFIEFIKYGVSRIRLAALSLGERD